MLQLTSNQGATNFHNETAFVTPCARKTRSMISGVGEALEKAPSEIWKEFPGRRHITEIKHVDPCDPDIPLAGTCPGGNS